MNYSARFRNAAEKWKIFFNTPDQNTELLKSSRNNETGYDGRRVEVNEDELSLSFDDKLVIPSKTQAIGIKRLRLVN